MGFAGSPMNVMRRLLSLEGQELGRVFGFFALYLMIFWVLGLADGLAISLFVKRVGASALPWMYGTVAIANLMVIFLYMALAERLKRLTVMLGMLLVGSASFFALYPAITLAPSDLTYGALFGVREIAYTLLLMHFGTFLQDFFTRKQLITAMPIVYAGGRFGGLGGAGTLALWSTWLPLDALVLLCGGLLLLGSAISLGLKWRFPHSREAADDEADASLASKGGTDAQELDRKARGSMGAFLAFTWHSPLMFWNTVGAIVYVGCRFVLHYQYNTFFDDYFETDAQMAQFMGTYSAIALSLAIVLQLFVVARLVRWIGLKGSTLIYASLLAVVMGANIFAMNLPQAILSRLLENELRFGLRNPLNQLVINKFSKALRVRVRAWSMGFIIPFGTIATSLALGGLADVPQALGALGGALGGGYLFGMVRLNQSYREPIGAFFKRFRRS